MIIQMNKQLLYCQNTRISNVDDKKRESSFFPFQRNQIHKKKQNLTVIPRITAILKKTNLQYSWFFHNKIFPFEKDILLPIYCSLDQKSNGKARHR